MPLILPFNKGRTGIEVSFITTGICNLGIRSLSAFLKDKGYKTRMLFLETSGKIYTKKVLEQVWGVVKDSDIICISFLSLNFTKTIQLSEFLKGFGKPVIWGGCLVTTCPEMCIKYNDFLCIGEGEGALFGFLERIRSGKNFYHTKNFWFKVKGKIIRNSLRPLIQDMDSLPFPDFLGEQFFLQNNKIVKGKEETLYCDHIIYGKQKAIFVYSTRGCVFNCSYCSNSKLRELYNGQCFVRKTSIKRLIQNLVEMKQAFQSLEYVYIYDDDFFSRTLAEIKEFSQKYKKCVALPFHVYSTPATTNEKKLKLLIEAGLRDVDMGIQTGSNRINKYLFNRGNQLDRDILRAARILNKYKHILNPPLYDFIINNPFETQQDLIKTIELMKRLPKPFFFFAHSLVFIPGTRLFSKALKEKKVKSIFDFGMEETWLNPFAYFLKRKRNVYLNALICLMWGDATEKRYGIIPASLLNLLTKKKVIKFMSLLSPLIILFMFFIPTPNRLYFLSKRIKLPRFH